MNKMQIMVDADDFYRLESEIDELRAASATDQHLLALARDTAARLLAERDDLRAKLAKDVPLPVADFWQRAYGQDHAVWKKEKVIAYGQACAEAERERCAKAIENGHFLHDQSPAKMFAVQAAAAIRSLE